MKRALSVIIHNPLRSWLWVVLFAVAFAWVESAVVVYLREIYFHGRFGFPLVIHWEQGRHVIDPLIRIEFGREIATIVMLLAVGWLAGAGRLQGFAFFMIAFGVWDIFYYVWLHVMVGWPSSLMTWDLLFYVPLPWVGPVITPLLIAVTLATAGSCVVWLQARGRHVNWRWQDSAVESALGLLLIVAFCWDWKNIIQLPGDPSHTGIPRQFAWWLYLPALGTAIVYFFWRLKRAAAAGKTPSQGAAG
jgi:hypothetical protein